MRIFVLGGGAAGSIVANKVAVGLGDLVDRGEVEIVVLDKSEYHYYQPGFLFVALGEEEPEHFVRKERDLLDNRIQFYHGDKGEVVKISPGENKVITKDGTEWKYDILVIALGSIPDYDAIPGFREGAYAFYTPDEALRLRDALNKFESGKIVVEVSAVPYKCPVAQYEIIFALHDRFKKEKKNVTFEYLFPLQGTHQHPVVSPIGKKWMDERGIKVTSPFNPTKIDPEKKVIYSKEGIEVNYDLLISIPPHKAPDVIKQSGLGDWIKVNPFTLEVNGYNNIYALGDNADLPGVAKAGSAAEYQASAVAKNIIARIKKSNSVYKYNGAAYCFIMTAEDTAGYLYMDYYHPPTVSLPSKYAKWMKLVYNELYWGMSVKAEL